MPQPRAGRVVITSTSIAASGRAGVLTGLGVAGATLAWATLAMLGLGLLAQLAWLTVAFKLAGVAYLVWIGGRMILGARRPAPAAGSMPGPWLAQASELEPSCPQRRLGGLLASLCLRDPEP